MTENQIEIEKMIWIVDIERGLKVTMVPTSRIMVSSAIDCVVLEENNIQRPIILLVEGDHEDQFDNL